MAKTCLVVSCFRDSCFSLEGYAVVIYLFIDFSVAEEKAEMLSFFFFFFLPCIRQLYPMSSQGFVWFSCGQRQLIFNRIKKSVEAYKFFVYSCRLQTFVDHLDP